MCSLKKKESKSGTRASIYVMHSRLSLSLTVFATGCVSLLLLPKQVNSAPRSRLVSVSTFIVLRDLPGAISS